MENEKVSSAEATGRGYGACAGHPAPLTPAQVTAAAAELAKLAAETPEVRPAPR